MRNIIYRVVCRFQNTEAAQAAARRIRDRIPEIYEIRLKYRSERSREGIPNNIVYSSASNVTFPIRSMNGDGMFFFRNASEDFGNLEYSDECMMSVIVKNAQKEVSGIMINSGGFDIKVYREQQEIPESFE